MLIKAIIKQYLFTYRKREHTKKEKSIRASNEYLTAPCEV
jgi:hypothetical protein